MLKLKEIFIEKAGLEEVYYNEFFKLLKEVKLKKREYLLRENSVCKFMGFVVEGSLRSYIQKDGDEFNVEFYLPNLRK